MRSEPLSAEPVLHGFGGSDGDGGVPPTSVVLVLHGGKVRSFAPARPWQLSSVRMRPFVTDLRRALGPSVRVVWLQYRYRGWNGAHRSPVADARWALERVRARYGDVPVVLVGHSMGGRTAAAVADDPNVTAVAALAPWWPDGDETRTMRPGQKLFVMHGSADSWTDPRLSRAATDAAAARGVDATYRSVPGAGHFMLGRPATWTEAVREFVRDRSIRAVTPNSDDSTHDGRSTR